jgi:hypothetical protein
MSHASTATTYAIEGVLLGNTKIAMSDQRYKKE